MLTYGIICEVDYAKGYCRVHFDESGIVSDWLSLPTSGVQGKQHCVRLAVNTQVGVLMHGDGEQGEIVNVPWNEEDTPPWWFNEHCDGVLYEDGTYINYDTSSHTMTVALCGGGSVKVNAKNEALEALLGVINGAPIDEPGNGAPSVFQSSLATALTGKDQTLWKA